jgi:hypothetical protein
MPEIIELTKKPEAIDRALGRLYDLAIDHAIEMVRNEYIPGQPLLNDRLDAIVNKLKSLKK